MLRKINSKIILKISIFIFIEIILTIGSFGILAYLQSHQYEIRSISQVKIDILRPTYYYKLKNIWMDLQMFPN